MSFRACTRTLSAIALVAVAAAATVSPARANLIVNGNFDSNSSTGCDFNLENTTFTSRMDGATAFGSANEIDIMDGTCGYASAPDSADTKIAIHTTAPGGAYDAFSLDLTSALTAGASYDLSFLAQTVLAFDPDIAGVEVGLSTSAVDFGTLVFASAGPSTTSWTAFNHTFIAPLAATFLTVRNDLNSEVWNHLDSFSLTRSTTGTVPAPGTLALLVLGCFMLFAATGRWSSPAWPPGVRCRRALRTRPVT